MFWNRQHLVRVLFLTVLLLAGAVPVMAHDAYITEDSFELGVFREYEHEDQNPFKGYINLTVTNTGEEAWGDFHFVIYDAPGFDSSRAIFSNESAPTSTQNLLNYSITNNGHMLNLFFYGDTVEKGESATFSVYTDNTTDRVQFFGIGFYASPVPVPGALILFGSGLLGLLGLRRRRADA